MGNGNMAAEAAGTEEATGMAEEAVGAQEGADAGEPEKEQKPKGMTKAEATALAADLATEGVGRYILAYQDKKRGKLGIQSLKKDDPDELFKMFCVTWDEIVESGMCIARIEGFRVDKNNKVYMVASPKLGLADVRFLFSNVVWDFFLPEGVMWQPYGEAPVAKHERFNTSNAYKKLGYDGSEEGVRLKMWDDMLEGSFLFEDLSKALSRPEYNDRPRQKDGGDRAPRRQRAEPAPRKGSYDSARKTFPTQDRKRRDEAPKVRWEPPKEEKKIPVDPSGCPLLYARMERDEMLGVGVPEGLYNGWLAAYDKHGLEGAQSPEEKIEAVLARYAELKEKEKEERRAARKARKAAKAS